MNKKIIKKISLLMLVFMTFLAVSGPVGSVRASGNTTIFLSKRSLEVGDTLSVTVQGTASDTISVSYTGAILSYVSSNNTSTSVSGGTATFTGNNATLNFTAQSEGTAEIIVTAGSLTGSSTTVSVSGGGAAQPEPEPEANTTENEPAPAENTEDSGDAEGNLTGVEAPANTGDAPADFDGDFFIDGVSYVVSERYSESEIPDGFSRTTLEINGGSYQELTNGVIFLIYLKPSDNTAGSGEMYIYDPNTNSAVKMNLIPGNDDYVIVLPNASLPTDRMVPGVCSIGDTEYLCYYISGVEDSGFAYFYGMNKGGTIDWMECDLTEGSMQRANLALLSLLSSTENSTPDDETEDATDEEADTKESLDLKEFMRIHIKLIALIIFILVVVILVILNIKVFHRDNGDDIFDDEEDSEDLLRRYAVRSKKQEEEDFAEEETDEDPGDYEEEYEEEYEEPGEVVREEKVTVQDMEDPLSADDVVLPKIDISGIEEELPDKEIEEAATAAKKEKRSSEEAMDRLLENMDIMDLNDL